MKLWNECSKQHQIERWENAVRVLKELTPHQRRKHWNMSTFGMRTDCGTVACAAGHCGMDPWFRRRGFKLEFEPLEGFPELVYNTFGQRGNSDVKDFFGEEGTMRIFYDISTRSVSTVIKEIKTYIKELKSDIPAPQSEEVVCEE